MCIGEFVRKCTGEIPCYNSGLMYIGSKCGNGTATGLSPGNRIAWT